MRYEDVRYKMASGDVLFCKRRGIISVLIRVATAETFNHVGLILRTHKGVFVVEMREGVGWQMMPASQWMEANKKAEVFWGKAPALIRGSYCVEDYALRARGKRYSYWSLLSVWWSQIWNRKTKSNLVCSTFVQRVYEKCGDTKYNKSFDPSDVMGVVSDVNKIST